MSGVFRETPWQFAALHQQWVLKLAEAMSSVATDYSDFFSANADELAAAVGHLFTHLKESSKKNPRLKLVYSKIKEGGRIESVEEFIGRFYDHCFEGV